LSSAVEWLQNSNRKLKERAEREQARERLRQFQSCETYFPPDQARARDLQAQLDDAPASGTAGMSAVAASGEDEGEKSAFFSQNAAARPNAPAGVSPGVTALLAEVERLRCAVAAESARCSELQALLASSSPRHRHADSPSEELAQLRHDNQQLLATLDATRGDSQSAVGAAGMVGMQLERARALLQAEQQRCRSLEVRLAASGSARREMGNKAHALVRLLKTQLHAAAAGQVVDFACVDALAGTLPAVEESLPQEDPAEWGEWPEPRSCDPAELAQLRTELAASQRKYEATRHSEALLCSALAAAHAALDSQQGCGRSSAAHSRADAPVPARADVATAEADALRRELVDAHKAAATATYELASLRAQTQARSRSFHAMQQDNGSQPVPSTRSMDDASLHGVDADADPAQLRLLLASARETERELCAALRIAITAGLRDFAAAIGPTPAQCGLDEHAEPRTVALKAVLARHLLTLSEAPSTSLTAELEAARASAATSATLAASLQLRVSALETQVEGLSGSEARVRDRFAELTAFTQLSQHMRAAEERAAAAEEALAKAGVGMPPLTVPPLALPPPPPPPPAEMCVWETLSVAEPPLDADAQLSAENAADEEQEEKNENQSVTPSFASADGARGELTWREYSSSAGQQQHQEWQCAAPAWAAGPSQACPPAQPVVLRSRPLPKFFPAAQAPTQQELRAVFGDARVSKSGSEEPEEDAEQHTAAASAARLPGTARTARWAQATQSRHAEE